MTLRLRVGDIVICMSSGSPLVVGKTAQLKETFEGSVGAFCGIIRLQDTETANYIAQWFRSPEFVAWRDQQARGANIQNLRFSQLAEVQISLPPLPEQKRIATILSEQMAAVEQTRAAAQAQLAAARELPAAYLREVFDSDEAREWPKRRLGAICHIQLGKMLSPASKTGNESYPYLRNANVQWGRFDLRDMLHMDFNTAEREKFSLLPGDLLVCEGGEPGRAAVWNAQIDPCYYQKALHRLRSVSDLVDPYFIMYRLWMGALQGEFIDLMCNSFS